MVKRAGGRITNHGNNIEFHVKETYSSISHSTKMNTCFSCLTRKNMAKEVANPVSRNITTLIISQSPDHEFSSQPIFQGRNFFHDSKRIFLKVRLG